MKIGTKSLLFGAHCLAIHPWFVALAWWKLYGFPFDPRLWLCFWVHDLGYFSKPNMDGPEGKTHPELGANIVRKLCGDKWGDFCLFHSRSYAKAQGKDFSQLCVADKLATALTPACLYIPFVTATGEIHEYIGNAMDALIKGQKLNDDLVYGAVTFDKTMWFRGLKQHMSDWAYEHKDDYYREEVAA